MKRFIYGIHPVIEALKEIKQPYTKDCVLFLAKERTQTAEFKLIINLAKGKNIIIEERRKKELDLMTRGGNHQGVILIGGDYPYKNPFEIVDSLISSRKEGKKIVLCLDEVQDPGNVGSIIRSSVAFGIKAIFITKYRSCGITPTVVKVSTGATEKLDIARVTNMGRFLDYLKEKDFCVIALDQNGEIPIFDQKIKELPLVALVVGNEHKGIRKGVKERCSLVVKVPILREKIDSLNVGVIAAIVAYELMKEEVNKI